MNHHKAIMLVLMGVFILIQVAVILGLIEKGYPGFVRGTAATTCLVIIYSFLESKYGIYMSNFVRAIVLITIISDSFFGQYLEYFITSTVFDKGLHTFGTYSFSLFFYILIGQLPANQISRPFKFIMIICLGLSLGAVYEIFEFIIDMTTKPSFPGQPSLLDTNLDLVSDLIGAIIAATHATFSKIERG